MRLKEIKPGMVIHCKTKEEMECLLEHLHAEKYANDLWNGRDTFGRTDCIRVDSRGLYGSFSSIGFYRDLGGEITEFSDLIIPPLSPEEVLEICHKICCGRQCNKCVMEGNCFARLGCDFSKVVEVCERWRAENEKKEPEVETEWFWQGRIYKVGDKGEYRQLRDGTGFYDTGCEYRESAEEYMADELKEYCKSHDGNYIATVEHICRVKQQESV